ncbi:alkaline phosphatase D family protein [Parapedomonas caeni]
MSVAFNRRTLLQAAAFGTGVLLCGRSLQAWPLTGFTHSVASGDPDQQSVTLWTRYVRPGASESRLAVEVARDERFADIVSRGETVASLGNDFCAHARPTGLEPGAWYFYRFIAPDGQVSPTGRTRTLPQGPLDRFRIAVMTCSNITSGWFTAYGHAAARDDLDLIVHLGDYIYESPVNRADALPALAAGRNVQPRHEAVTLADYRLRYASYRADADLQELHRRYPFVVMWDDHETANDSWTDGAKNHDPAEEGPWPARRAAGIRAFYEWLPMRPRPYSRYRIGDLATLFRLETRLIGRTQPLNPEPALAMARDLPAAVAAFIDGPLADPSRTLLGPEQMQWLADGLAESTAAGVRWQVLAQQVVVGPRRLPRVTDAWFTPETLLPEKARQQLDLAVRLADLGMPMSLQSWSGYPAELERMLRAARAARANLVTLSGDSHNAWAFDLELDGGPVGIDLCVHAVSSLGLDKRFSGRPDVIANAFIAASPALRWCDTSRRGYMMTELTRDHVNNEWLFLPSRQERSLTVTGRHIMQAPYNARRLA